jgi:hypothetical protein
MLVPVSGDLVPLTVPEIGDLVPVDGDFMGAAFLHSPLQLPLGALEVEHTAPCRDSRATSSDHHADNDAGAAGGGREPGCSRGAAEQEAEEGASEGASCSVGRDVAVSSVARSA